ncbi:HAD family hydrolase [Paenibacillus sp. GCM10027626]|uniref:HAD family hydrolase n=1 Tax=Paenibacillus sp. GCM10027626 TaxID=3273411 RepID=UPI003634FFE1
MTKQTLLFDLDDTLIYCNRYFYQIINQFTSAMTEWFKSASLDAQAIRDKQIEIDLVGVNADGFKSDHFPQSFVDTYRFFSELYNRPQTAAEIDFLWKLGRSVYEHEVEAYPNMESTLDRLASEGHELHLYTGGEVLIQQRKIDQMQLTRYFGERIYVRKHKNIEAMEQIVASKRMNRDQTWMIGNSIRTDIVPAFHAGINAIHLESESEWVYNIVDVDIAPKGAYYQLRELAEVPQAISEYVSSNQSATG